jgi:hypothetical protein
VPAFGVRHAALLDVARARRRDRRDEQRHDDRACDPAGRLVDMTGDERLLIPVVDPWS